MKGGVEGLAQSTNAAGHTAFAEWISRLVQSDDHLAQDERQITNFTKGTNAFATPELQALAEEATKFDIKKTPAKTYTDWFNRVKAEMENTANRVRERAESEYSDVMAG